MIRCTRAGHECIINGIDRLASNCDIISINITNLLKITPGISNSYNKVYNTDSLTIQKQRCFC